MNLTNDKLHELFPREAPDRLTEGVIVTLSRRMSERHFWRPVKTVALGLISGGLLPLIFLPLKFRNFIFAEREQLRHFAEWFRLRFPGNESQKFHDATLKLKFNFVLWLGALLMAVLAVWWASADLSTLASRPIVLVSPLGPSVTLTEFEPFTPRFLFAFTARLPHTVKEFATMPRVLITAEGFAFLLIGAHLICLWQVLLHITHVRKAIELFNVAAKKYDVDEVDLPRAFRGVGALWIIGIVALAAMGAWWGVPMLLAAAAQARYIGGTSRKLREALAARTFNLAATQRPALGLPLPGSLRREKCGANNCNAQTVIGAQFCPQCGTRVVASAN